MEKHFIEASNSEQNWGKFLILRFNEEEKVQSAVTGNSLLREVGWNRHSIIVFDLQTGEGARFLPGGFATADLEKHKVWVCPMFEPFLNWLYLQDLTDLSKLPKFIDLPDAPFEMFGHRRKGPEKKDDNAQSEEGHASG